MVTELPYGSAETVISLLLLLLLLRGSGMLRRPRYIGHADHTPGYIVVLDAWEEGGVYLWLRFISVNKFRCDFLSNYFENEYLKKIMDFPYFLNEKLNDKVNETRKKSVIGSDNSPNLNVYR